MPFVHWKMDSEADSVSVKTPHPPEGDVSKGIWPENSSYSKAERSQLRIEESAS